MLADMHLHPGGAPEPPRGGLIGNNQKNETNKRIKTNNQTNESNIRIKKKNQNMNPKKESNKHNPKKESKQIINKHNPNKESQTNNQTNGCDFLKPV